VSALAVRAAGGGERLVKVCPQCGYEYEPQVTTCPECAVPLVEREAGSPPQEEPRVEPVKLVPVCHAATELDLVRAQSALKDAGIPSFVRSFQLPAMDDMFVDPSGAWGELLVAEADLPQAMEIIEVITTGEIVPAPEPEPAPGSQTGCEDGSRCCPGANASA